MRQLIDRILNSEFLSFHEILRLKVLIVTIFLIAFIILSIPIFSLNNLQFDYYFTIMIGFFLAPVLTILLTLVNFNRTAMHFSILTIIGLNSLYIFSSNHFYGYLLLFVGLTVIIFYQDIITYIIYGGAFTIAGIIYIELIGSEIVGLNSIGITISTLTYQGVLLTFYIVFLVQFIISDNIYESLNNEWVRMNKMIEKYQSMSTTFIKQIEQNKEKEPLYSNPKFQQTVSELTIFINEFFEEKGEDIAEAVEYYFFLHEQDIDTVIENKNVSVIARKYAMEFSRYLLNSHTEMRSILYNFSTLFKDAEPYTPDRYEYNLDNIFEDKVDKLLSLAMLYRYLKTEQTQYDKWGHVTKSLSHEEITERFVSKEFREFISFEQVNFYLDNEELFQKYF